MTTKNLPRNPEIRKLLKSFETMPEYLEERRRKIQAEKDFAKAVFEEAILKSGMMERLKKRK
ncbi:MAG: hypothetical protein SGJ02_05815 [bacterium]|nr:hypothetical protein [bacterium]